jgi:hypothetical protein
MGRDTRAVQDKGLAMGSAGRFRKLREIVGLVMLDAVKVMG